jgi:CrcB protein
MKTVVPFLAVGVGGFLGSIMRYGLSLATQRFSVAFPHGTLAANLLGCLIIGALSALSAKSGTLSPTLRLLLATGLCGGRTTMSTFTYELFSFVRSTEYLYAAGYFAATVAGCAAMFCLGLFAVGTLLKG